MIVSSIYLEFHHPNWLYIFQRFKTTNHFVCCFCSWFFQRIDIKYVSTGHESCKECLGWTPHKFLRPLCHCLIPLIYPMVPAGKLHAQSWITQDFHESGWIVPWLLPKISGGIPCRRGLTSPFQSFKHRSKNKRICHVTLGPEIHRQFSTFSCFLQHPWLDVGTTIINHPWECFIPTIYGFLTGGWFIYHCYTHRHFPTETSKHIIVSGDFP